MSYVQLYTLQSNKKSRQFLGQYYFSLLRSKNVILLAQTMWAVGSSFEILMAYLIIPRVGWRILVLVSALAMVLTFIAAWVCCKLFTLQKYFAFLQHDTLCTSSVYAMAIPIVCHVSVKL